MILRKMTGGIKTLQSIKKLFPIKTCLLFEKRSSYKSSFFLPGRTLEMNISKIIDFTRKTTAGP